MQRTLVLAAVATLAVAVTPTAVAKEITKAEVCGADGCASVADETARMALMEGGPARTPPTAAPYYEVQMEIDHGDEAATFRLVAMPDQRAFRADDGAWYEMTPEMAELLTKVAAGTRAFPAAGLIGAAPTREPPPAAAGGGNPLWTEGVKIALVLAVGGVFLAVLRVAARRASRAWSRRDPAGP